MIRRTSVITAVAATVLIPTFHLKGAPRLKEVFKEHFLIGAAVNEQQIAGMAQAETALLTRQFNSITPENLLKWESVHPEEARFNFTPADAYVAFGETNKMFIVGHTLIWHQQTPAWVFKNNDGGPAGRELLLARMRDHIHELVGRYKGRVKGWDVVNEALRDNGALRDSPWRAGIGDDFVLKAFKFAHEADPAAELYYNDYSLETPAKRQGAIALIKQLQAAGIKVAAVGLQDHNRLTSPTIPQLEETIDAFARLGIKVMITELDLDVLPAVTRSASVATSDVGLSPELNPYTNGLPESVQRQIADRYSELFLTLVKHDHDITRVTFWGVTDAQSWLNNWPVRGRTAYPLLFDRAGNPKPAFYSVVKCGSTTRGAAAQPKNERQAPPPDPERKAAGRGSGPEPGARPAQPGAQPAQ